jgi:hypothetical protein
MTALRWATAVGLALLCSSAADARWKPEYGKQPPEVQAWFNQQHNAHGEWCCNESDGHPFFGDYSMNEDGSVTLHAVGEARKLPAYMVLKGPNPTGHAVWWYLDLGDQHRDYCFAPGTRS